MTRSESITKIAVALSKAQKNIGAAAKGAANPFFKSKYADLGSVMEACKEALNAEGITVLQPVTTTLEGKHAVETVLLHESGEFISSVMTLELTKTNMQDLGSAITYARRYSLQSLAFIPSEDDDGEKAMARGATKPAADAAPVRRAASFERAAKKAEVPVEPTLPVAAKATGANGVAKAGASAPVVETAGGWE